MNLKARWILLGALAACTGSGSGLLRLAEAQTVAAAMPGQNLTTVRATELRSDKLGSAPILQTVAAGATLRLVSVEGGWALVEATGAS